jgi:hypothetical protein
MLEDTIYEALHFFNIEFTKKYSLDKKALSLRDVLAILDFISSVNKQFSM